MTGDGLTTGPEPLATNLPVAHGMTSSDPTVSSLRPLSVSAALAHWAWGLALISVALLIALLVCLAGVLVIYGPAAWSIDVMIVLACIPVVIAVIWIVRRAVSATSDDFVREISATPLLEIMPPPRPAALASPLSTLRAVGLAPLTLGIGVLALAVIAADAGAFATAAPTLIIGSLAVTAGGMAMLGALLLTMSLSLRGAARAITAREHEVGVRFYALSIPASTADGTTGLTDRVCVVPEPV